MFFYKVSIFHKLVMTSIKMTVINDLIIQKAFAFILLKNIL